MIISLIEVLVVLPALYMITTYLIAPFYFWKFVHNFLIHPWLAFPWEGPRWLLWAHDWTAERCKGAG